MAIDLISLMAAILQSRWFLILVVIATAACIWYYISHSYHAVRTKELQRPGTVMRTFLFGQSLTLLIVLIAVCILAVLAVQVLEIKLP